jgi:asparagine synthase (glutamine-hydrolysing)
VDGEVGLGQRRLAIIDLDPRSVAPLGNEDQRVWVVFNGEIYNFRALRAELERKGHRFATASDTEVIVHLYEEDGPACVERLRGMFALAIWDKDRKRMFLARDRLGKKPLFYAWTGKSLVFGSEIKALLATGKLSREPNLAAIDRYLTWQYIPSPDTAFVGINRLTPGHVLTCDAHGKIDLKRFWAPPVFSGGERSHSPTEGEARERVLELLDESVQLRMEADVPLGAFLSGGIDSGVIVALMARHSPRPVRTFTIGFDEGEFDERPWARLIATRYGTVHQEFLVRPEVEGILDLLIYHFNEPFADSSAIPTFYLSKMTRTQVTVALSGDGGDESWAGYLNYRDLLRWGIVDQLPSFLRRLLFTMPSKLLEGCGRWNSLARLARGLAMVGGGPLERFVLYSSYFKPQEKRLLYTPSFRRMLRHAPAPKRGPEVMGPEAGEPLLAWMMRHDQSFYLPDCLMMKTDIASMANSLEVRCPLLDHILVEYAAGLPPDWKLREGETKSFFRSIVKDLLPVEILQKPKTGFAVPMGAWLRGNLRVLVRDTLESDRAVRRGLFQKEFLKKMVDEHMAGARDWSNRLWALLFLELWFRHWID